MQLLAINEELGLQGPQIEQRVSNLMRRHNLKTTQAGLSALKDMALTVLDADFPRDVLATHNLTFRSYLMPLERSRRKFYDAIEMGPPEAKPGTLILGSSQNRKSTPIADPAATFDPLQATALLAGGSGGDFSTNDTTVPGLFHNRLWVLLLVAAGLVVIPARKTMKGRRRFVGWGAVLLVTMTSAVVAQAEPPKGTPALQILIQRLGDAEQASLAAAQLVASGDEALPALVAQSRSSSITRRGWAIICLGQLEAPAARQRLAELLRSAKEPDLIRIWAGAALIRNGSLDDGCRQSARQYPELGPLLSAER